VKTVVSSRLEAVAVEARCSRSGGRERQAAWCEFLDAVVILIGNVEIAGRVLGETLWKFNWRGRVRAFTSPEMADAATSARLNGPERAVRRGVLSRIRQPSRAPKWTPPHHRTVTGDGTPGPDPRQLNFPQGLAQDATGNLYIADQNNDRVQELAPSGLALSAAGTGAPGFNGDGFPARRHNCFHRRQWRFLPTALWSSPTPETAGSSDQPRRNHSYTRA